ncbi:MAG: dienelactone hydrolase family protein [Planctomycetes bacterium]|nr:dienelactone hydrolase family protein [Planctomycetota bacterium]
MFAALLLALAPQTSVTRSELAQAYERFERVYFAAKLEPERKRELNRAYDEACLAYFGGEQRKLVDELERMSLALGAQPDAPPPEEKPYDWDGCRMTMLVTLSKLTVTSPAIEQALCARARAALLHTHPSPDKPTEFRVDRRALATALDREIGALERGDDPYSRATGDLWRVLRIPEGELPVRIYAPTQAAKDTPLPLVIALHGARGDENMFLEGYGCGRIRDLAEQHGFLLACPRSSGKLTPETIDALVRALGYDYAIDEKRIGLVGHSMGAALAARLASESPGRYCALACFSGGPREDAQELPPTWIRVGVIDQLADPAGMQAIAQKRKERGFAIDFQTLPDVGHTLIVGEELAGAIDWVLGHRRSE